MNIYPAIDLLSGTCVRLYQGSYDQVTFYEKDPIKLAQLYEAQGARYLHVVDLDGAKQGQSINSAIIKNIKAATGLQIQTGGGIRSKSQVDDMLSAGIDRIVLGSIAVLNPMLVNTWIAEYGAERFVLALDVRVNGEPYLATHGWETNSTKSLWQVLADYQGSALHVLCTDISCDGTLQGPNIDLYQECVKRFPSMFFQASGGVASLADLQALAAIPVSSVIVGKALYEQKFNLIEALKEVANAR